MRIEYVKDGEKQIREWDAVTSFLINEEYIRFGYDDGFLGHKIYIDPGTNVWVSKS